MSTAPEQRPRWLRPAIDAVRTHRQLVILTFELFWVLVFVLWRHLGNHDDSLLQFAYQKF